MTLIVDDPGERVSNGRRPAATSASQKLWIYAGHHARSSHFGVPSEIQKGLLY